MDSGPSLRFVLVLRPLRTPELLIRAEPLQIMKVRFYRQATVARVSGALGFFLP